MPANLEAAQSGDARAALVALRDTLAAAMDEARPDMLPQLAGQYRSVVKDLASMPGGAKVSKQDELKRRREERIAAAAAGSTAKGSRRKRGA